MHQLGYELPERPGFGGLLLDERPPGDAGPVRPSPIATDDIHAVASSTGPRSADAKSAVEAFREAIEVIDLTEERHPHRLS